MGYFPGTRKVGRSFKIPIESYNRWKDETYIKPAVQINNNERTDVRTYA